MLRLAIISWLRHRLGQLVVIRAAILGVAVGLVDAICLRGGPCNSRVERRRVVPSAELALPKLMKDDGRINEETDEGQPGRKK